MRKDHFSELARLSDRVLLSRLRLSADEARAISRDTTQTIAESYALLRRAEKMHGQMFSDGAN
jgi:hypothetical protein